MNVAEDLGAGDLCVLDDVPEAQDPTMQEQCWVLSSSDEEPAAAHSQAGRAVPRRTRVHALPAQRRDGAAPAPPVRRAAPPVERAVGVDRAPPVLHGPRVCRVSAWPKMLRHQHGTKWSYLRVSQTWGKSHWDMRAVCACCGSTFDKNCNNGKRPVGLLWSWLIWSEHHCVGDRNLHHRQRPDHAARKVARAEFEALAGNDQWLDAEGGGRGGGEPIVCP